MAICKCLPPPRPLPPKLILQFSPHKNPKRKFFISFFTHQNLSGSHCLAQIGSAKTSPPRAPSAMLRGGIIKTHPSCQMSPKLQHPGPAACRASILPHPHGFIAQGFPEIYF